MATAPAASYVKSMYTKFKRYAAWPPGQRVKLGTLVLFGPTCLR